MNQLNTKYSRSIHSKSPVCSLGIVFSKMRKKKPKPTMYYIISCFTQILIPTIYRVVQHKINNGLKH